MNDNPSETSRAIIVVGIDGSADTERTTAYSVQEALRTERSLRIIHVIPEAVPMAPMLPLHDADALRAVGSQILVDAERTARDLCADQVEVETVLARGPRIPALLAHTDDAALIVLGRRSSTLARVRTGSTTSTAAARATCPVVVVPEQWSITRARGGARARLRPGRGAFVAAVAAVRHGVRW